MSDGKDKQSERPPVVHYVVAESAIAITEHARVRKSNEELGEIGYVDSNGADGTLSRTDRQEDGSYSRMMQGAPTRGERDTLQACRVLIQCLNARGGAWSDPVSALPDDTKTDAIATDGVRTLRMQHTRADGDSSLYHALARSGEASAIAKPHEFSAKLARSIATKADEISDPLVKQALVLVLDAQRLPVFCMTEVRSAAIRDLPKVCTQSGFEQIWVVGPVAEMTYQLWPTE